MRRSLVYLSLIAAIALLTPAAAFADITNWGVVSHAGSNPFGTPAGEQQVTFTLGATGMNTGGSNYLITGTTSISGDTVEISTNAGDQLYAHDDHTLVANPSGNSDTSLDQLAISIPGFTFTDAYTDLVGAFTGTTTATFLVTMSDGQTFSHTYGATDSTPLGSVDNWVYFNAANGETISSISITSRWSQLYDLNLSGVASFTPTTPVPEPATFVLAGSGLLGILRRKKR